MVVSRSDQSARIAAAFGHADVLREQEHRHPDRERDAAFRRGLPARQYRASIIVTSGIAAHTK